MSALFIWCLVAGIALVIEMLTGTFYLLVLSAAAGVAALGALFDFGNAAQLGAFALAATAGAVALRRWKKPTASSMDTDVGGRAQVLVVNADGSYRVRYRGTEWDATLPAGASANPGDALVITAIHGIRLSCRKA